MAGDVSRRDDRDALLERAQQRDARRQDRGLLDLGPQQLLVRTLEAEPREREAERGVGRVEDVARGRRRLEDVAAHADLLRALPGKEQCEHGGRYSSFGLDDVAAAIDAAVRHTRCGGFGSPHCGHLLRAGVPSASCDRRWSRLDFEVFRFGNGHQ